MSDEQTTSPVPEVEAPSTEPAAPAAKQTSHSQAVLIVVKPEELKSGMTVRVHERIKDVNAKGEERERIQVFEGIVLAVRGAGISRTMTVRKEAGGFGVEKIYPIFSPVMEKIELVKTAKTRRAKLWYLGNVKKPFERKLKEKRAEK